MVEYTPKKVFVLESGTYLELSCTEFRRREYTYHGRRFIPLHGMLMEVPEDAYKAFYKRKRREKYLKDRSKDNGDFSYDMLTTDEFNGEDILVDTVADTQGQAESRSFFQRPPPAGAVPRPICYSRCRPALPRGWARSRPAPRHKSFFCPRPFWWSA